MTEPNVSPAAPAAQPAGAPQSAQAQIDSVMNLDAKGRADHPYWNERHKDHQAAVDAMFTLRQGQSAVDEAAEAKKIPGRVEAETVYSQPVDDRPSSGDYGSVAWPSSLSPDAQTATARAAADFNVGASELGELMKTAAPHMSDNRRYSFEQGEAALKKELGEKYEGTLKAAKDYIAQYPGLLQWLTVRGLASHPAAVKVFAARMQGRADVQAEIDKLTSDPDYLGGRDHAKHQRLVDKVFVLRQRLSE